MKIICLTNKDNKIILKNIQLMNLLVNFLFFLLLELIQQLMF